MKYATEQEASAAIAHKVAAAYALINEAEEIAEANGVDFSISLAYGMGGNYIPASEYNDDWHPYRDDKSVGGWCPSSQSC